MAGPWAIALAGNTAFVTAYSGDNIVSVDISTAASPSVQAHQGGSSVLNDPRALVIDGSTAYVSSKESRAVVAVDISDPTSSMVFSNVDISNGCGGESRVLSLQHCEFRSAIGLLVDTFSEVGVQD